MSDIVKKLRSSGAEMAGRNPDEYMTFLTVAQADAAADYIESLEAEVERLRDKLRATTDSANDTIRALSDEACQLYLRVPDPDDLRLILDTLNARIYNEPVADFFRHAYKRLRDTLPEVNNGTTTDT